MSQVTFVSDSFVTEMIAENIRELKGLVSAKLDKDINWGEYAFRVNGFLATGDEQKLHQYDEVHAIAPTVWYDSKMVVQRPFLQPYLERPQFAFMREDRQIIGVYACQRCDAPIVKNEEFCQFCGYQLDWGN